LDPTPLTESERELAKAQGYFLWTPPKKGFTATLPLIPELKFRKYVLTNNTAPANITTTSFTSSLSGGLYFSQTNNNVIIKLLSLRKTPSGLKKFYVESAATASSFLL
jgi:hypothetical protein